MHNIYRVWFIFIISYIVVSIRAHPISSEDTQIFIHDVQVKHSSLKCPYLKTTKLLEPKPTFLRSCSDYSTTKSTTSLNRETGDDVLCLFYYNNFVLLCDSITNVDVSAIVNNNTIEAALKNSNLSNTCNILRSVSLIEDFKNAKGILLDFKTPYVCEKLCSELIGNTVIPICSLAAYSLNVTSYLQNLRLAQKGQNVIKQVDPSSVVNQPTNESDNKHPPNSVTKPKTAEPSAQSGTNSKPVKEETQKLPQIENVNPPQQKQDAQQTDSEHQNKNLPQSDTKVPEESNDLKDKKPKKTDSTDAKPKNDKSAEPAKDVETDIKNPLQEEKHDVAEPIPNVPSEKADNKPNGHQKAPETKESDQTDVQKSSPESKPPEKPVDSSADVTQDKKKTDDTSLVDIDDQGEQEMEIEETPVNGEDVQGNDGAPAEETVVAAGSANANAKPQKIDEDDLLPAYNDPNTSEEDPFFFMYFMMVCAVFILGYIGYHNKQKVLALVIEGRRGKRCSRRGRPNSANYHKLDSNLEEAVTSSCNKNTTNIIY